jgi:hypothetical protein
MGFQSHAKHEIFGRCVVLSDVPTAKGQKAKPQKKLIIKLICEMEWV